MLMLTLFRLVAAVVPWVVNLATWLLARTLNMPQPLVHDEVMEVARRVRAAFSSLLEGIVERL